MNIYFSSSVSFKCTPLDRQMYPWGYMYPRLGTPELSNIKARCYIGEVLLNHVMSVDDLCVLSKCVLVANVVYFATHIHLNKTHKYHQQT